ncbi:uncharacterized protein LOC124711324 isoform X1 [Schistocerca piceifrons]|uniref:uncharacterized protein LOC124711324 isoform X1 n=1 Tax=Schistocerca piceifrons TaxID=274613 RepID=UPI001F5F27EE|nr:uncharacterized protein LOC124711324 isoform X1 [Schistocerca piceifrons]
MDDEQNWFDKFTVIVEQNIRGVQIGIYSVGVIGLVVALKSVRPFSRFVRPQDIPKTFVERHVPLKGRVLGVELGGPTTPPLLMVDHQPIVSLTRQSSSCLPVHIAGVDISGNGISWMQSVLVGDQVKFTPLKINPSNVSCIVKASKGDVAVDLVSVGFATVSALDFTLEKDPLYITYYKRLLKTEKQAERKGHGMWATNSTWFQRIWRKVSARVQPRLLLPVALRRS